MRILIPGGSGQVGAVLARHFHARGHQVTILSRGANASAPATSTSTTPNALWHILPWDAKALGPWTSALDGCDIVINLAGRSVNCRYTPANRREIMDSRVDSTRLLGGAIAAAAQPPRLWLQASTATIYAHRFDAGNDEHTGILGATPGEQDAPDTWRFSIDVATAWERACTDAPTPHTRKVLLRSAMVMSPDKGGIFDTLLGLTRRGLGGPAAGGRQYISWVHEIDFCRALDWLIDHDSLSGAVNIASPNPIPQREFMAALRASARRSGRGGLGARLSLPATHLMLELGARLMGTETELILKSRRVIPTRLLESGFGFRYPDWPAAADDLCRGAGASTAAA